MRLALALLFALTAPLSAQTVEVTAGASLFGPMVDEVDHRVRLGTRGQDMTYGVSLAGMVDWWGIETELAWTPTTLTVWPTTGSGDVTERPTGVVASEPVTWSCWNIGPVFRGGWFQGSAGAGVCQLSSARYGFFGSAPMHAGSFKFGGGVTIPITDGYGMGVRCDARPTVFGPRSITVLRIASGELEPGEHSGRQSTFWALSCSLSATVGGDR